MPNLVLSLQTAMIHPQCGQLKCISQPSLDPFCVSNPFFLPCPIWPRTQVLWPQRGGWPSLSMWWLALFSAVLNTFQNGQGFVCCLSASV